ncbi:hypothetical protein PAHAL_9G285400 [Panicum hallii]|uniref:Uncharacterized protein n=1 Tax=Panicum hallii TaxID=206008 RepID=A0A2T8I2X8_9POAL|nr:hypothetical protein PAHAL_9G285400 [Panicum hallii]
MPALQRRGWKVGCGEVEHEDFIEPSLFFTFSEVLWANLSEQWFLLYLFQLYLYLHSFVFL